MLTYCLPKCEKSVNPRFHDCSDGADKSNITDVL